MRIEEAEQQVLSRELFGMRFGLDRMRRMMTVMGHPQRRFRSIHVVGTNGKSSTTRMIAAILAHHGLRVGSYLSPHLLSYAERIRIGDRDLTAQEFADAIERALVAAEHVDRHADEDDRVTQFELLTAAAYSELARHEVEVGVIEAGLGGHYDATNVIPSSVQVLTGVGLEHTRWLGPTITAIAREKLDVVQPGATLVLGSGMHPDAVAVAREITAARGASIIQAEADPHANVGALGAYQRRNFALARTAAAACLGSLDEQAITAAAAEVRVPGRLQIVARRPLTLLDGAHNPDGMCALVESLPEIIARRPSGALRPQAPGASAAPGRVVAVVSILDDKDAAKMLATLAPLCDAVVLCANHNPRVLPPPTLLSLLEQEGASARAEVIRSPKAALAHARELAGPGGVVVATGSLYLVSDLLAPAAEAGARRASMF